MKSPSLFIGFSNLDQLEVDHLSSKIKDLRTLNRQLKFFWYQGHGSPSTTLLTNWDTNLNNQNYIFTCSAWRGSKLGRTGNSLYDTSSSDLSHLNKCISSGILPEKSSRYSPHQFLNKSYCCSKPSHYNSWFIRTEGTTESNLLQKLLQTSKQLMLVDTNDLEIRNISRSIDHHIRSYEATEDEKYLYTAALELTDFTKELVEKEKTFSSKLYYLVRKILCKVKRDLRQSYRSIIRFLFKNMDADTDDSYILFGKLFKQNWLSFKKYQGYDETRNYCWSKRINRFRYLS